jgi:hypothetical protein
VHIHKSFSLPNLFDAALQNLNQSAADLGLRETGPPVLLLTESRNDDCFEQLRHIAGGQTGDSTLSTADWRLYETEEPDSLVARNSSGNELIIVSGRQIVTRERLEILALATASRFPDGESIDASIERVRGARAVAVLPWGFGKWLGARGKIVQRIIRSRDSTAIHIGDNGGRLRHWPEPREFREAIGRNLSILPGTDPLPFPGEETRVGRIGFALPRRLSSHRPAADIRQLLSNPEVHPIRFGVGESLFRFLRNQVAMQLQKRRQAGDQKSTLPDNDAT